ncbi:MAG TPA: hemerythrin domain-containing protein [bacterium]|nr:hemerythrin domain-containing protein [bacterium]
MKRERFLWPLTQSHHGALLLAKRVREQLPGTAGDPTALSRLAAEVRGQFQRELGPHFGQEGEILEVFGRRVGAGDPDILRILDEHRKMEAWAGEGSAEALAAFAETLTRHIRFEEEVLFPRWETLFTEDEKRWVSQRLGGSR